MPDAGSNPLRQVERQRLENRSQSDGEVGGRAALAEALFRIGALRFGKFKLPDDKVSAYRLDLGIVPSEPEAYGLATAACMAAVKELGENSFDAIAGVATAGVALSSPLAYLLRKPLLSVRLDESRQGAQSVVEGAVPPGWRTLIVDDLAMSGASIAVAADALRRSACVVKDAIVLVDGLGGAKSKLASTGVRLDAFTDVRDLVQTLYDRRKITKADWQAVMKQMEGDRT